MNFGKCLFYRESLCDCLLNHSFSQKAAQNNGRWGKGCPLEESKKRSSGESDQKSFPESDSVPFSGEKKQKRYNKYGDEIED